MARSYKSLRRNFTTTYIENLGDQFFFMGYSPDTFQSNSIEAERNAKVCSSYARKVMPTEVAKVIKRYDWTSDTLYDRYKTEIDLRDKKYYVKNSEDNVYICLENSDKGVSGGNQSNVEPTGRSSVPFRTNDGYLWKYVYTIDKHLKDFLKTVNSVDYMPVKILDQVSVRRANVGATDRSQYNVERQLGGKIESATIDLSETIGFSTNSPTLTVIGDGNKEATVTLSVNNNVVNGISVTNSGSGYNYATVRLDDTPTTHTVSEVEAKISLNISPENTRRSQVPAESYFHIEKIMYNIRVDTADLSSAVRQTEFNFYGLSKDYILNKSNVSLPAGSELLTDIKKNYRLSQRMRIKGETAASATSATFDYSTSSPTFNLGDGITDIDDVKHQALVTFFGRPRGYTGVSEAVLEIVRETGTGGNGTGGQFLNTYYVRKGFGVTSGSVYYNVQSSFATADIKPGSGDVLYINYLDSNITMTNELVSNFVFLQEV